MQEKLIPVNLETTMLDPEANYNLKANLIPSFRFLVARQRNLSKKIILKVWGGLGDMITAQPCLEYALDKLIPDGYEVSLESMLPELSTHNLHRFTKVYDHYKDEKIDELQYYVFDTIASDHSFQWEFMAGLYIHCVDFSSLLAFRCQLPLEYKEIKLEPSELCYQKIYSIIQKELYNKEFIVLHPGKHWPSKTFPKWWWDGVIKRIVKEGIIPVIIGGHKQDENGLRTTVDVDTTGCLDLRCKLQVMETVALLKLSKVLLTNDSAPLHMAASTDAWIGFIATCKHPQYITHYRKGIFGWRMENLGLGGIWEDFHFLSDIVVVNVEEKKLLNWLPKPEEFARWGINKLTNY